MRVIIIFIFSALFISCGDGWTELFNGKDLDNWFVKGEAVWEVKDGIMIGDGGMGHIYTNTTATDF